MDRLEKSTKFRVCVDVSPYWEKWLLVEDLIQQLQYEHEHDTSNFSRVNEVAWQIVNATREE